MPRPGALSYDDLSFQRSKGDEYRAIFQEVYRIIALQKASPGIERIKGFVFYGESGTGKTHMAKMVAHELGLLLLYVDSSMIARKHFGDCEQLISKFFEEAKHNKALLLFDDVEFLFLNKANEPSECWNRDMNRVVLHQLDNLDASKCSAIMTTNQIAFLDKALVDRLALFEFQLPSLETLLEVAKQRCADAKISSEAVEKRIRLTPEDYRSMGAVEKDRHGRTFHEGCKRT